MLLPHHVLLPQCTCFSAPMCFSHNARASPPSQALRNLLACVNREQLPRDDPNLILLTRMLQLAVQAKQVMRERLTTFPMVSPKVMEETYPILANYIVVGQLRALGKRDDIPDLSMLGWLCCCLVVVLLGCWVVSCCFHVAHFCVCMENSVCTYVHGGGISKRPSSHESSSHKPPPMKTPTYRWHPGVVGICM